MGFFKKQLLNVIEWTADNADDLMVYRYPVDGKEIKNGAQLTVRESQVAIFVNEGQLADVFQPGRYKLITENLPILTKLQSWKYGFNSPFKAEIYFINTKQFQGRKWGTANPFALRDDEFGLVRIRAYGTYSLRVDDAATFLKEVFGTAEKYRVSAISEYTKSMLVSSFTDFLSEQKLSVLDIPTKYLEIGEGTKNKLNDKLKTLGLKVADVIVENISLPDEVEKAIDQKSSINVLGNMNTYTQFKTANAIENAASNPNGIGGAGAGVGLGIGLSSIMSNNMNNQTNQKVICPHCNSQVPNGKFCPECGKALVIEKVKCINCHALIAADAKFCPECGASQEVKEITCPKCHNICKAGAKFCPECGEKL